MAKKPIRADLDFQGRNTARNLREPEEPEDAATKGYVMERLTELPIDQTDPGDQFILAFENSLI